MEVGFKLTKEQAPTTTQELEKARNIPYQSGEFNVLFGSYLSSYNLCNWGCISIFIKSKISLLENNEAHF